MTLEPNAESTNIWDYKPWWCQPWSIVLAGTTIIASSWLILHIVWITLGISVLITVWWIYFLVIYPQLFAKYVASKPNK
ncbi:DUF6737 family protein [Pleurocapsa sp. PCC 7319]|uniref:DUF6737 family protein n=1 Tax=Pleurocapsa sp. PCC 7319 TaxID=118161 RepID=UPI00035C11C5|nr:DUF6737 family protein [Pleurocapsa sp. PCC 7319]